MAGIQSDDAKVSKLMEMGFDKAKCVAALAKANGDENVALEALLTDM